MTKEETRVYFELMNTVGRINDDSNKFKHYWLYVRAKDNEIIYVGNDVGRPEKILEEGTDVRYIDNISRKELNDQDAFKRIIKRRLNLI